MSSPITSREFRLGRKVFNAEHIRILRAARRGALTLNEHGRWLITDEAARPARKERERLLHRDKLITYPGGFGSGSVPTHPSKLSSGGEYLLLLIDKEAPVSGRCVATEANGQTGPQPLPLPTQTPAFTGHFEGQEATDVK